MDIIRSSCYILGPWCDEIDFCCFICVTQWWALHVVIKRQFYYIYICCFSISIHSWDTTTSASRKQTPYGNSNSGFDFEPFIVIGVWFCTDVTNFIRIGRSLTELLRYVDFPRWRPCRRKPILSRYNLWRLAFRKTKNYLRTKFLPDISIHGRYITTTGCWKQNVRQSTSGFWFGHVWQQSRTFLTISGLVVTLTFDFLLHFNQTCRNTNSIQISAKTRFYRASICEGGFGSRNSVRLSVCHTHVL